MDNIENVDAQIDGDNVTLTPAVTPVLIATEDYRSQLLDRLNELNQGEINTQAQLTSIQDAKVVVQSKLDALPPAPESEDEVSAE